MFNLVSDPLTLLFYFVLLLTAVGVLFVIKLRLDEISAIQSENKTNRERLGKPAEPEIQQKNPHKW